MSWPRLLADLDAQLLAAEAAELDGEVAERTRIELGKVRFADRLRAASGELVALDVDGVGRVGGRLERSGDGWALLESPDGVLVVLMAAVTGAVSLPAATVEPGTAGVGARLGAGHVLRALARDRAVVRLLLRSGQPLTGTIDRVGADFVDLAEHDPAEPRRAAAVTGVRTVPFAAIAVVRASA